jgi:hypothetical protein
LKSFLPVAFSPNRRTKPSAISVIGLRDQIARLRAALQDMARSNLDALLAELPPVAAKEDILGWIRVSRSQDPLAGYRLADWRDGKLPDAGFVAGLMQDPGRSAAIASVQSGLGSELILPRLLHIAFVDGALRHDLAQSCRAFLSARVLFHPGPPPQPLFSPMAIAALCLSQPAQVPEGAQAVLQEAVRELAAETGPASAWDQWLYRRMGEAPGWQTDADLDALPWVFWRRGDPLPAMGAELPGYWPNLIDLDL